MIAGIKILFSTCQLSEALGSYFGLVQTQQDVLRLKLDQLSHSEFEAGLRSLQQAGRSGNERDHLLREARQRFNQAVSLEIGLRRAYAYLALAICHYRLDDFPNAEGALRDVLGVTIALRKELKDYAAQAALATGSAVSSALGRFGRAGETGKRKLAGLIGEERKIRATKEATALLSLQDSIRAYLTAHEQPSSGRLKLHLRSIFGRDREDH